ncbi:MAG TPA: tetratricopeptide repeat protein [Thermodesulfobacteriota bacterium]
MTHASPCCLTLGRRAALRALLGFPALFLAPRLAAATQNPGVAIPLDPGHGRTGAHQEVLAEVDALLDRWRPDQARQRLMPLLDRAPRDPAVRAAAARVAFYAGDYAEAVKLADGVSGAAELDWLTTTRDTVARLAVAESRHFVLRHDRRDAILVEPTLEALERGYELLEARFRFTPPAGKVRVELYPDARSFYPTTGLSRRDIEASGAVGLCIFNKVMLLSPRALLQGYRWQDAVVHEYVHYAVVHLTANTAPIWVHEGIAKYYETRWRSPESLYLQPLQRTLLAEAVASGRFVGFAEMEPSLVKLPGPREVQLAYAQGASAVEFLETEVGPDALPRLFAAMATLPKAGAAVRGIEQLLGVPFAEFERRWRAFVAQKGLDPVPGIELPAYHVKEGIRAEGGEAADEALELQLLRNAAARTHARLGDRLRERGRLAPAIMEYRKAVEKGPPSATLLTRLGSALAGAGRRDEARETLGRVTSLYPDYPSAYVVLGRLELAERRYQPAVAAFREALAINPFDPTPHAGLAVALRALGHGPEADRADRTARALGFTGELEP